MSTALSAWDAALVIACVLVGLSAAAPQELAPMASTAAGALLFAVVLVWYQQRQLRPVLDEFPKLRAAALAVQVLWLTVLYDLTTNTLPIPEQLGEPLSSLFLAAGAAALGVAVIAALDLAIPWQRYRLGLLTAGSLLIVAGTQVIAPAAVSAAPLAIAGIILGIVSPMGWLITLDRQQRISVLLGGLLSTIPLIAGMSIHLLVSADPQNVVLRFIRFGSVFCFSFVLLLLIRAAQAMSGAALYERKVRELDAVYDFGLTSRTALDPQEFHTAVLRSLRRIGSPDVAAVVEPDSEGGGAVVSLLRFDADGEHIYRHRSRASWEGVAERFVARRPLVVADHSRAADAALPRIWEPGAGSSVSVPVLSPEGEPRAVLIAGRHDPNAFPRGEVRSLSGFASQVGLAMEHALLLRELVESERRKGELEIARQMQLDLLPKRPPPVDGLDIADRSIPATEVGGDYFDYLSAKNGGLGLVFGDVAGHGMTAGLLMAMAKSAIHTQVKTDATPGLLLPRLGELLLEMSAPNQYMTMVFVRLNVEDGRLWFVNAGHHYPLHFSAASGEISRLEATGPPLGLLPSPPGEPRERELGVGDVLVFYSDGLVEAMNHEGDEFGIDRLARVVGRRSQRPAASIVEEVYAAVTRFCGTGDWHDDATLVVVRVVPPEASEVQQPVD